MLSISSSPDTILENRSYMLKLLSTPGPAPASKSLASCTSYRSCGCSWTAAPPVATSASFSISPARWATPAIANVGCSCLGCSYLGCGCGCGCASWLLPLRAGRREAATAAAAAIAASFSACLSALVFPLPSLALSD